MKTTMFALAMLLAIGAATAGPREFDGLLEPSQTVEIRSPVAGLIDRVHVARGSAVKKGTVIVSLESSVERTAVELARYKAGMEGAVRAGEGRLLHAERKLKRRSELADKNFITAQEREDAEAEHRIAHADLQAARENKQVAKLEHDHVSAQFHLRQIRSPIDGVVVEQGQWPGELADFGDGKAAILKLAQINPLKVTVVLPASLYPKLKTGMRAEVVPEKPNEGRYPTTVGVIDKVIDAASGTFRVQLMLPNPTGALPGGLKCRVVFPELG